MNGTGRMGRGLILPILVGEAVEVDGSHPAGLIGTAIHFIDPVGPNKQVRTVGYQDVIAIGKLFTEGKLYTNRVVALVGPQVSKPRLVHTQLGSYIR